MLLDAVLTKSRTFLTSDKQQRPPVAVFDLDETLLDSRARAVRVMRDLAQNTEIQCRFLYESGRLLELTSRTNFRFQSFVLCPERMIRDEAGINSAPFLEYASPLYLQNYLSSRYCCDDDAIEGAPEFVRELHARGTTIVYLTGRNAPNMETGTRSALLSNGFPLDSQTVLLMKPAPEIPDSSFKGSALDKIRDLGEAIAAFDNESNHLNTAHKHFPCAILGFVDTIHSDDSSTPDPSAFWIKNFLRRKS
ncbi:MAG: hypothetical protein A2428_10115 [Bdellovibrionales bacterium RIFOXYC1_FULL_54_43]|nr:MAG: hypothetical protein A2428_10115 [Bdellovibrionales bacterium RIFOXYC1_FULL_54_43]OFZ80538.1 MAG: hypothetical protein A2603_13210 [Bdellovibrionales bacterium RIFOXYD1_FULL_55_31]